MKLRHNERHHNRIPSHPRSNKNILYPPANPEQILELETLLGIQLPNDYKEFLLVSNGFEGFINEFYGILDPAEKIHKSTLDRCVEFFPWAIYIGTNGNTEMFVIDTRSKPYQFGLLPFIADDIDFIPLGDTF